MNIIKNPMNLNYVKKFICICKRKSNQSQDKHQLISSSEIIPFFSLKGKLKTSAKITKVTGKTECNVCFNYNGEITKFAVRLYGLESLKDSKNITSLGDLIPASGIVYLVAHNFDTDGKLLATIYISERFYTIGDMSINELILIKNNIDGFINNDDPFFEIIL